MFEKGGISMSKFSTRKWGRKILATVVAGSLALTMPMISKFQLSYVVAAGNTVSSTYDSDTDVLTVTGYNFYTLDKVDLTKDKPKVPAANKWIRTNAGAVNLSTITKEQVLTLAQNITDTSTFVSVKVAAPAIISKFKYVAVPATTADPNLSITIKGETAELKTNELSKMEFRVNNETVWNTYANVSGRFEELGKNGATIYARVKGNGTADSDTDALEEKDGVYSLKAGYNRAGTAKALKLGKKAAGPAVAIDYDNHTTTIKKGQEYGEATANADPAKYTAADEKGTVISLTSSYYGVRTAAKGNKQASNATTVYVPDTTELESTGMSVSVTEKAALFSIEGTVTDTYQYALITKAAYEAAVTSVSGKLCYNGVLTTSKEKKSDYKWISVKPKNSAIKDTKISVASNDTSKTYLLVRKAGNKSTGVYSSTIVVFTKNEDKWTPLDGKVGYGGSTAAGNSGTTTAAATATASFTGTTTVPKDDEIDDVVVTIAFENASLTGLAYSDFTVVAKDAQGNNVSGLNGVVFEGGITGNTVTLNVAIANSSKVSDKQYEKLEITLPTSLKIEGNTVVATK